MSSPFVFGLFLLLGLLIGGIVTMLYQTGRVVAQRKTAFAEGCTSGRVECEALLKPQISSLEARLLSAETSIASQKEEIRSKEEAGQKLLKEIGDARGEISRLETNLKNELDNAARRREDEETLSNRFARLSQEALAANSGEFIKLAKTTFEREQEEARGELKGKHDAFLQIIQPVGTTMAELKQSVGRLSEDKDRLATEAKNLSNALRRADIRGRWGEIHLERVAELAGMHSRCDFFLQQSFQNEDERKRRPDMVVRLPLGRYVVVDSKAVMDAYMSACEATDHELSKAFLDKHAKQVRAKIDDLAKTDYAKILGQDGKNVADMVVCFIPGEAFFSAAVAQDPGLLEYAVQKRVFLASPTILITLLRAIALGWRDHQLSANAEEISRLGQGLYARLSKMQEHFDNLGEGVKKSVESYNSMVSSLNRMVFPQARRFRDLGAADISAKQREITESRFVDLSVQRAESADWRAGLSLAAEVEEIL